MADLFGENPKGAPRMLGICSGLREPNGNVCGSCGDPAATLVNGKCTGCATASDTAVELRSDKPECCGGCKTDKK